MWSATATSRARTKDRTLARLQRGGNDLIDPTISVHHGRIVKRTGDGSVIEFRSVVDAVRCALEVQHTMVERNAGIALDKRIEFRIGIHLGDVVEESDGDLGRATGSTIAARAWKGIAKPGGINLSGGRLSAGERAGSISPSTDLGPTQLKNIAEPIRVYSLDVQPTSTRRPAPAPTPEKSLPTFLSSSSCPSPISVATRSRSISSTGSRRASRPTSHGYEAPSWSPAIRRLPSKASRST